MATINKNENINLSDIIEEIANKNNIGIESIGIEGEKCGIMGYTSEKDRRDGIQFLQGIVDHSNKKGMELLMEIQSAFMAYAAKQEENIQEANVAEDVEINGETYWISYENKAIYAHHGAKMIANCIDLPDMPKEALKEILVNRAKANI